MTIIASLLTGQGYGPIAAIEGEQKIRVFFRTILSALDAVHDAAARGVADRAPAARPAAGAEQPLVAAGRSRGAESDTGASTWCAGQSHGRTRAIASTDWSPECRSTSITASNNMPSQDRLAVRKILAEAVRTGEPFRISGRVLRADGKIRHVKSHGSLKWAAARPSASSGTVQDVTETAWKMHASSRRARSAAERVANTDMLTGLPNRRHTLAFLEKTLAGARDHGAPLAVAIFDIDHFKRINDAHGHAMGDTVIRRVALRAKAALRDEDPGRADRRRGIRVYPPAVERAGGGNRRRARPEKPSRRARRRKRMYPTRRSASGSPSKRAKPISKNLLHRADKALYVAKREGRNRPRMAA